MLDNNIILFMTASRPRSKDCYGTIVIDPLSKIYTAKHRFIVDIDTHLDLFVSSNNAINTADSYTKEREYM